MCLQRNTRAASTLIADLKACSRSGNLSKGRSIHEIARRQGDDSKLSVAHALIDMYAKCWCIDDARKVFAGLQSPAPVSWSLLISGCVENGECETALDLFSRVQLETGRGPDGRMFVSALKASTAVARKQRNGRERGRAVHILASRSLQADMFVESALVDMYGKCGCMEDAGKVFVNMKHVDVVSWNAIIWGYADNGEGETALRLLARMAGEGCAPCARTFVSALKACSELQAKVDSDAGPGVRGRALHLLASRYGCDSNVYVKSSLIDIYAKFGRMRDAHLVFDSINHPDVVSWTVLMLRHAENGQGQEVLQLFDRMKQEGCQPNAFTFVSVVKACAMLRALDFGRSVHAEIQDRGFEKDVVLATCLVDFYAKCGSLAEAEQMFVSHASRALVSWTSLMTGYSRCGNAQAVFRLFNRLLDSGLQPDRITLLCVLTACNHAGLVEKGQRYFEDMPTKYAVAPDVEHYTCMVDMLGRANNLEDAMLLLRNMPVRTDAVVWNAVIGACRKCNNAELGKLAFESLTSLDDTDATYYVLMANTEQ